MSKQEISQIPEKSYNIDVDYLRKSWKCQNFRSILVKPEEYSVVKDLKSKIFYTNELFDPVWEVTHLSNIKKDIHEESSIIPISISNNLNTSTLISNNSFIDKKSKNSNQDVSSVLNYKTIVESNYFKNNNNETLNNETTFSNKAYELDEVNPIDMLKKRNDMNTMKFNNNSVSNSHMSTESDPNLNNKDNSYADQVLNTDPNQKCFNINNINNSVLFNVPLKKNLKKLLEEDYSSYLGILKDEFPKFKKNHYNKINLTNSSKDLEGNDQYNRINVNDISLDYASVETEIEYQAIVSKINFNYLNTKNYFDNENNLLQKNKSNKNLASNLLDENSSFYQQDEFYTRTKAITQIDRSFFIEPEDFKISSSQFSLDKDSLANLTYILINDSGYIEAEILKILKHSSKIFNYICNNLVLDSIINDAYMTINNIREKNQLFKKFYLNTTLKNMRFGLKKRNLDKIKSFIMLLGKLKNCKQCLTTLSKSSSKYQIVFDLVNKSRDIINKTQELTNSLHQQKLLKNRSSKKVTLNCISNFEKDFNKYTTSSSDKALSDLINLLKEEVCFKSVDYSNNSLINIKKFSDIFKTEQIYSEINSILEEISYGINSMSLNNNNINTISNNYVSLLDNFNLPNLLNDDHIKSILNTNSNSLKSTKIVKMKEMLNLIYKLDLNFYTKLSQTIRSIVIESFDITLDKLNEFLISSTNNLVKGLNDYDRNKTIFSKILTPLVTINYLLILVNKFIIINNEIENLFVDELKNFHSGGTGISSVETFSQIKIDNIIDTYREQFRYAEKELLEEAMNKIITISNNLLSSLVEAPNSMTYILVEQLLSMITYDFVKVCSSNVELIPNVNDFCNQMNNMKNKSAKTFFSKWCEKYSEYLQMEIDKDDFVFLPETDPNISSINLKISNLEAREAFSKILEEEKLDSEKLKLIFRSSLFYKYVKMSNKENKLNTLSEVQQKEIANSINKEKENLQEVDEEKSKISINNINNITNKDQKDNKNNNTLCVVVGTKKYKIISSTVANLNFLCEIARLVLAYPNHHETLFSIFFKKVKNMAFEKKDLVLDAKGVGKNFAKASQNQIVSLVSDINFIISVTKMFIENLPLRFNSDILKDIYSEFKISMDSIVLQSRSAVIGLYTEK
jgi:hypothetical protein